MLSSWNLHWSSSKNVCLGWCLRCGYSVASCRATHSVSLLWAVWLLFLADIPRTFGIQNIQPPSSPFRLAIDVIGRGALWVALPCQPSDFSWVVGSTNGGTCSWILLLDASFRLELGRAAFSLGDWRCLDPLSPLNVRDMFGGNVQNSVLALWFQITVMVLITHSRHLFCVYYLPVSLRGHEGW
jgi:hypothetical protein